MEEPLVSCEQQIDKTHRKLNPWWVSCVQQGVACVERKQNNLFGDHMKQKANNTYPFLDDQTTSRDP